MLFLFSILTLCKAKVGLLDLFLLLIIWQQIFIILVLIDFLNRLFFTYTTAIDAWNVVLCPFIKINKFFFLFLADAWMLFFLCSICLTFLFVDFVTAVGLAV